MISPRRRTRHRIAMTLEDAFDFEVALKEAFPDIRFLRKDYGWKWYEGWKWRPLAILHNRYQLLGPDELWMPSCTMRDPGNEKLLYRDTLTYPWESDFLIWREPPGWRPKWACIERNKNYELTNLPPCRFEFGRSSYSLWGWLGEKRELSQEQIREIVDWLPPKEPADNEVHNLTEESMFAWWDRDNKEAEHFVRKVFHIADKFMTNTFRFVDRHTLMPYQREPTKTTIYWAGHHAMRWAAERRHNYIFGFLKPPDYDFGEDEPPARD